MALEPSKEEIDEKISAKLRNEAHAEMLKSQRISIDNEEKRKRIDAINKYLENETTMPGDKRRSLEAEKWTLM